MKGCEVRGALTNVRPEAGLPVLRHVAQQARAPSLLLGGVGEVGLLGEGAVIRPGGCNLARGL